MSEWLSGLGIGGLFTAAGVLIWRLVRLGVDQEARLLRPAYARIGELERRIDALEIEQRKCEQMRARALYRLTMNGLPTEDLV